MCADDKHSVVWSPALSLLQTSASPRFRDRRGVDETSKSHVASGSLIEVEVEDGTRASSPLIEADFEDEAQDGSDIPWPEFADGTWDFKVPADMPVKIVGWTGMGMLMVTDTLKFYYPLCTWSDLPHTDKDISYWHGTPTGDAEYVISDPDTDISDADVVLFYLPYLMRNKVLPSKKREGQLWIATCAEALNRPETDMDCSMAQDREFMAHMDGFSSYHGEAEWLDSSIELFPAFNDPPEEAMMREAPPAHAEFGGVGVRGMGYRHLVSVAISDCDSGERNDWITAIKNQFDKRDSGGKFVSYGKCFHNTGEPGKDCEENRKRWFDPWSNRCASRPFKLVAENRNEPWYITEKVWDALWEGSVPVYFGPKEIKDMVPPGSIIYWGDYETPEALADYLLSFDAEKLAEARAWKTQPMSEWGGYANTRKFGHLTLLARFCEAGTRARLS